jgi:two-component system phosphate regulon response regulator PhoB
MPILVVEDHDPTRTALVRLLTKQGYESIGAANGELALSFLRERIPQLILLDYMMPGLNGMEVLKIIRKTAHLAHVPAIIFTAAESIEREAIAAGANAFIVKGKVDWGDLLQTIQTLAGPPEQHRPADFGGAAGG